MSSKYTNSQEKPLRQSKISLTPKTTNSNRHHHAITEEIKNAIQQLNNFATYPIRDLVKHAEQFGPYLKNQRLETNQVRKFLDAINRIKADLANKNNFAQIEAEVVLLKPKLAYAAARQKAAKPLSEVMSTAIDKVKSLEDFNRLVQFIESIIAYHKAAGGR